MKEMNVRLSIMAVDDLTAAQKLIMLYLLTRVDWDTWQGSVSANDIEQGTAQSKRNIKRSLKALEELGYISREITRRETGLHHKALVKINTLKIGDRKSPPMVTESHHQSDEGSDRKSPPIVTESHHPRSWGSDKKSPPVVTKESKGSDRKSPPVVTNRHEGSDRKSPNNNIDQYTNNINQYTIKTDEELDQEAHMREDWLQPGHKFCDRCRRWVKIDEPHTYPHSTKVCTDQEPTAEEVDAALAWDLACGKHELEPITEELRDGLWYVSRIDDNLQYRQDVHRECTHHRRYDVRDALLLSGGLLPQMMKELIAPRSAIDWCTLQASGELPSISTPAAPPEPSKIITISVEDQQRMKEVDRAWAVGSYDQKGQDEW